MIFSSQYITTFTQTVLLLLIFWLYQHYPGAGKPRYWCVDGDDGNEFENIFEDFVDHNRIVVYIVISYVP